MFKRTVIGALTVWATSASAPRLVAQTSTDPVRDWDPVEECARSLVPYVGREALDPPEWSIDVTDPSGGRLTYIGAAHSRDPLHPQFAQIARAWERVRPTVAFYEGPTRPVAATAEETIREYGESGYVRFLADAAGVRVERLEPPPQAELAALRERFPLEQIKLFYVLRETARLRDREGLREPELRASVAQMLDHARVLFGEEFGPAWTLNDLDVAYRRYWTEPTEWWRAPGRWFTPGDPSGETGGIFTNDVNRTSSEFRDRHMYIVLAEAARRGERAFAVVGRDHVPAQAAAIRCALQSP